ncbi:hypothetical protein PFISCL1PPCAC_19675 [Pristionchus fissidentatus]|uniref:HECT-type E3 ubiquitin transferase n=1 Tax=Pristionchus fissidentatus TaxID=1538716 RepID=A0AAV5WDE9_9BILA|nr:hypothetical protein PFISCL1PPCAC_19675 [Pristionchus fissidentatus]
MEGVNSPNDSQIVHIQAIAAKDIAKRDIIFKGASSPYIRVRLQNQDGSISREHILPTRKKTRNPEWRSLDWKWNVKENQLLQLTLFDEHKIRKDRELGSVTVNVDEILTETLRGTVQLPLNTMSGSSILIWFASTNSGEMIEGRDSNLPEGWEARTDTNGRVFYVDHVTQCTQWMRPDDESRREDSRNDTARRMYYEERAREVEETALEREVNEEVDGIDEGMSQLFDGNGVERAEDVLPPGWEMQAAPNGRTFFIDHNTRKTTWDDPRLVIEGTENRALPEGWEQRLSADGKVFFVDHINKKTSWEDPRFLETEYQKRGYDAQTSVFKRKVDYFRHKLPRSIWNMKCTLTLHRQTILEDSFHQVMAKNPQELRCKLWIELLGERALDYGGVSREWCFLLSKHVFNPYYGLFEYSALDQYTLQVNPHSGLANPEHLEYFHFIGRIIGIALYHGKLLDVFFIRPFYKQILGQKITLEDMETVDGAFYNSLCYLRDNDDAADLELVFAVDDEVFGEKKCIELEELGKDKEVNDENKGEYMDALIEWKFTKRIQPQMERMLKGIFEVIPSHLLRVFDPSQLELLMCGLQAIDVSDWRAHTMYKGGYNPNHIVIHHFWQFVLSLSNEMRARLVQFVTGTSRIPMSGFRDLYGSTGLQQFTIELWGNESQLPRAHTCFNRLDLPPYSSYNLLKKKMMMSMDNSEYFSGVD